jgi:hypothetical protein
MSAPTRWPAFKPALNRCGGPITVPVHLTASELPRCSRRAGRRGTAILLGLRPFIGDRLALAWWRRRWLLGGPCQMGWGRVGGGQDVASPVAGVVGSPMARMWVHQILHHQGPPAEAQGAVEHPVPHKMLA